MGTIGREAILEIGAVEVQNITSCDMSGSFDLADDTTNDSAGNKENCYADRQVTLDVTCKYAETGGIEDLLDEFFTNAAGVTVTFQPLGVGVGTKKEYVFSAKVSSLSVPTTTGETIDISFTLESSGAITYQLQA